MLRTFSTKFLIPLNKQNALSPIARSMNRALPVQTAILHRYSSTKTYTRKSEPAVENDDGSHKFSRHYVQVDTPLANANRYTYAMPEDPYVASEKVARILEIGTVDDAADYIKALPIYLQSSVIWNQIIGYCAKFGRATYAEQYFSQMRKRGIEPNERTFTLMLSVYGKSTSPNAIKYAEAWIKKMKDFNLEPSLIHINNLMRVYNNADHPEKALDALNQLSTSGNIIPDAVTYTIALQSCSQLTHVNRADQVRAIWLDIICRLERKQRAIPDVSAASSLSKKAAEIVWTEDSIRGHGSVRNKELEIDDSLVIALLSAVTQTAVHERDILTGLEAIDRLYSLCPPSAAEIMEKNGIAAGNRKHGFGFQPSVKVLDAILRFSGGLREFKLGKEYYSLAVQQFPRLKPDKYVNDALAWIEKQLKRSNRYGKKRNHRSKD